MSVKRFLFGAPEYPINKRSGLYHENYARHRIRYPTPPTHRLNRWSGGEERLEAERTHVDGNENDTSDRWSPRSEGATQRSSEGLYKSEKSNGSEQQPLVATSLGLRVRAVSDVSVQTDGSNGILKGERSEGSSKGLTQTPHDATPKSIKAAHTSLTNEDGQGESGDDGTSTTQKYGDQENGPTSHCDEQEIHHHNKDEAQLLDIDKSPISQEEEEEEGLAESQLIENQLIEKPSDSDSADTIVEKNKRKTATTRTKKGFWWRILRCIGCARKDLIEGDGLESGGIENDEIESDGDDRATEIVENEQLVE